MALGSWTMGLPCVSHVQCWSPHESTTATSQVSYGMAVLVLAQESIVSRRWVIVLTHESPMGS